MLLCHTLALFHLVNLTLLQPGGDNALLRPLSWGVMRLFAVLDSTQTQISQLLAKLHEMYESD